MLEALMISLVLTGDGAERNPFFDDKPFQTITECLALKYQYDYTQMPPKGFGGVRFVCIMVKAV